MLRTLSRLVNRYIPAVVIDAVVVVVSFFLAWGGRIAAGATGLQPAYSFVLVAVVVYGITNRIFGLYHHLWRYASSGEVLTIGGAAALGTLVLMAADYAWPGARPLPISVVLFGGFFAFAGFVAVRYRRRAWNGLRRRVLRHRYPAGRTRLLIVGAGEAGQLLAWRLQNLEEGRGFQLVGFVDDDPAKVGMRVHGAPVLGGREAIPEVVVRQQVEMIVVAIYNLSREALREILAICERTPARIKVLPNPLDFIERKSGVAPIRDVTTEDLLGRPPVRIDRAACHALLAGKVVLVTGAAGSIGSELCRQIAGFRPQCLLMLDNNESGLHDLSVELAARPGTPDTRYLIADVTNRHKLALLFAEHRPRVVFHAAAYKHVPLMEAHPDEAVRVNVLGTRNVLELACEHGAERFVFISTDKAVNPSCVMGATKRLGELLVSAMASESGTLCTGVRFGNVLGSRGSVVPIFEQQIAMGGPVTVTDPEMTRFFMSIPEAVSLVIQAATVTEGGDLFILNMGEQVRIVELAERLIRLRGLRPGVDIPIKYTGIRPGEKLREELTGPGDEVHRTAHPAILRLNGHAPASCGVLFHQLDELIAVAQSQGNGAVTDRLWEIVRSHAAVGQPTRRSRR